MNLLSYDTAVASVRFAAIVGVTMGTVLSSPHMLQGGDSTDPRMHGYSQTQTHEHPFSTSTLSSGSDLLSNYRVRISARDAEIVEQLMGSMATYQGDPSSDWIYESYE